MAWDKNLIREGVLAPDLNNEIRDNWEALEASLDAWIRFATGGTQTGQPRQGSARVYFQDAVPTSRLDGEYFDSTDLGCIWIDSNSSPDNQFNFLSAADGAGTETWTPISTEIIAVLLASARVFAGTLKSTGDFTVGANKVVVTASNGNTAIAGTLGVTGVATLGDSSQMATSAAPTADADLANKKYIDDRIGLTYRYLPVDGSSTKVYTKYLTGTLDNDSETLVAHGVSGVDNILAVVTSFYNSTGANYYVNEMFRANVAAAEITVRYDGTNIIITDVASQWRSQKYRIKIDYK